MCSALLPDGERPPSRGAQATSSGAQAPSDREGPPSGDARQPSDPEPPPSGDARPPSRGARPPSDLTARARIREVAIELFGSQGYRGASIRDLAREAGVSPGLVQHHFGSKAGLRAACDAHVIQSLRASIERKMMRPGWDRDFVSALHQATGPTVRYIARGLSEGWLGSEGVFDEAARGTARWMTETWPERYPPGSEVARRHAAIMTAMSLGTIVLHRHLARWLGVDPVEGGRQHATIAAMIEIFLRMAEFFESEPGRGIRKAFADYERELGASGKRDGHE